MKRAFTRSTIDSMTSLPNPAASNSIRAVIFDIGGVLVRTEDLTHRRLWEARFGLPDWGLAKIVFDNPVAVEATLGRATTADVWRYVGEHLKVDGAELEQLEHDFWLGDRYDHDLIAWISNLRPGVKTAILSNAWDWMPTRHGQYINGSVFDYIAYSQEIGLAKPTPASFQHVLDKLDITAPEAIFVDDFPENIAAANALGLHGILFRPQDDVRAAILSKLG